MQPNNMDDGKLLTFFFSNSTNFILATLQYFDECQPPELLDVEIRKNRATRPNNRRPPSIDFLKRSKDVTMDTEEQEEAIEVEVRSITARRLSFQKSDTKAPSVRHVESMIIKQEQKSVPPWLLELKNRKKKDTEKVETTKSHDSSPDTCSSCEISPQKEENNPPSISKDEKKHDQVQNVPEERSSCISETKSDYSVKCRRVSRSRPNKTPEAKPTLSDLQKGAEKINKNITELQRDMQILLEHIKQMQINSSTEQ